MTDEIAINQQVEFGMSNSQEKINLILNQFERNVDYGETVNGKNSLWAPGVDKLTFIFNLRAEWERDDTTLSMIGDKNVICFVCKLYDRRTHTLVGEGRGAAKLGEGGNCKTINSTIKMAERRAIKDATLNVFPVRDRYTQDVDEEVEDKTQTTLTVDASGKTVEIL